MGQKFDEFRQENAKKFDEFRQDTAQKFEEARQDYAQIRRQNAQILAKLDEMIRNQRASQGENQGSSASSDEKPDAHR
ncbi:MAG: hypothetical protein ISN28_06005 [Ectothiorhodospiraceae bacterium AqS1]|nr:hypothetical protein [Ectothiorhodospiraceae bacterium AqS1]